MGDLGLEDSGGAVASAAVAVLPSAAEVQSWTVRLAGSGRQMSDAERIDLLRAVEELKCAAEGAQAEVTADFDVSQRAAAAARGVPAGRRGRGIGHQVAFARRESPHRGQRHVGLARVLRTELPCTRAALRAGRISEWKATLVARETACLSLEHRMVVDEAVAGDPARVEAMGERELVEELARHAARLDPAGVAERRRRAEADRHTSLRPAPDTMTWFGALLPVKDGVAVHAALTREADRVRAAGDPRSRGAIMADTLVARVLAPHIAHTTTDTSTGTGAGSGAGSGVAEVPLHLHVVVPDTVLFDDPDAQSEGSGWVDGYGPVPGDLLREWVAGHAEQGVKDWVTRLYRARSGDLVAMDSTGRRFEGGLAEFLRVRDRRCRNPWCDAPIRHLDHPVDYAKGGATSARNGQGLCEACNHAKQAHGWTARPLPGARHTIETTTPTGHRYQSVAPATGPPRRLRMELYRIVTRVA